MRTRGNPRGSGARRRRLTALLGCAVAVLAAAAPGLYAAAGAVAESQRLADLAELDVQAVSVAHCLADERDGMALFVAEGRPASFSASALGFATGQRAQADSQIRDFTAHAADLSGAASPVAAVARATARLRELPGIRGAALAGHGDVSATVAAYGRLIDALGGVGTALSHALPPRASADAAALPALTRAVGQASVERALLVAALAGGGEQRRPLAAARAAALREQDALAEFHGSASSAAAERYDETVTGSDVSAAESDVRRLTGAAALGYEDRRRYPPSGVQSSLSLRVDLMRQVESSLAAAESARISGVRDDDMAALELRLVLLAGCLLLAMGALRHAVRATGRPAAPPSAGAGAAEPPRAVRAEDPEPGAARAGNAGAGAVGAGGAEAGAARAEGPEPGPARAEGAGPGAVRARGAEPGAVRARGAEPGAVRAGNAGAGAVGAGGAEADAARAEGPQPGAVRGGHPEPGPELGPRSAAGAEAEPGAGAGTAGTASTGRQAADDGRTDLAPRGAEGGARAGEDDADATGDDTGAPREACLAGAGTGPGGIRRAGPGGHDDGGQGRRREPRENVEEARG